MNINNMRLIANVHQMTNCQNVLYIFAHSGEKKNFKPNTSNSKYNNYK